MAHDSAVAVPVWCEFALLPDGVAERVALTIAGGRVDAIERGVDAPARARRRPGITVPGIANAHSHAFHRALRHRSQSGPGSFWTWREQMYAVAAALDPDSYHRLARLWSPATRPGVPVLSSRWRSRSAKRWW